MKIRWMWGMAFVLAAGGGLAVAEEPAPPAQDSAPASEAPRAEPAPSSEPSAAEAPPAEVAAAPATLATIAVTTPAPDAPAKDATELDTVTVTAQKRAQSLVDVPINVSAVSRDDVRNVRIEQVRDLSGYVSNVDIKEQVPGAIPVVSIRGVGLDDFSSTNSPAAGIYVDQVTLSSLALMSFDLFDVQRIEVLKGPQGTLYGRNSTAGAINVLSATPTMQREGSLKVGYGTYKTGDLEGMYNLPLGDTLALRVAGKYIRQDEGFWRSRVGESDAYTGPPSSGYTDANPVVRRIGKRDVKLYRARLAWEPTTALTLDLKVDGQKQRSEMGQPEMFGTMCQNGFTPIDPEHCTDALQYTDKDHDPYLGDWRGKFPYDIDQTGETLTADYDLGWATVTSVSGQIDFKRFFHIDVDGTPADEFEFLQGDTVKQFTQELRLTGSAGLGDWLLGGFYGKDRITIGTDGRHQDLIPGETSRIDADQHTTSSAAFANMDWKAGALWSALDEFTLTTGLRYTDETRRYVGGSTWTPTTIPGTLENTHEDSAIADKNWSWKLGLNWKPTASQLLYANASRGVKSGGYFAGVTNDQHQLAPYLPEKLLAYEAGYKRSGALAINASVFSYDYRDKQTFMRAGGAAAQYIGNVPEARCRGVDFDATVRAFDGLTLTGGVGLLRTWMGEFVGPVDANMDQQPDTVPAGNQLPNSPELTWLARARYELPLFGSWLGAAQVDAHYSDGTFKEATNDKLIKSDPYTILNGRLSFLTSERTWELSFWGKNLTDERYVVQGLDIATFFLGNRNYNAPRTFGAELLWNF